jgi:GDP/UDP-N,N'-diacetylbacillosamine 2-epimerase (hydrolysing)
MEDLAPDLAVVLGDRFEIQAAATACTLLNIPICHIAGGEITTGAFDDALRHSISKMSSLHFTTHDAYRTRVIQMGAHPSSVITTGSLAIDNILNEPLLSQDDLEKQLDFKLQSPLFVLTYHPETRLKDSPLLALEEILMALNKRPDISILITEPNSDPGSYALKTRLTEFAKSRSRNTKMFASLGRKKFLSLLKYANGMIGNSSSGISEAPVFNIGTINIGDRQTGRLLPKSILTVPAKNLEISKAIENVLSPGFKTETAGSERFYGNGTAAQAMIAVLQEVELKKRLSTKFYDLP